MATRSGSVIMGAMAAVLVIGTVFGDRAQAQDLSVTKGHSTSLLRVAVADEFEQMFWETVRDSDDPDELNAYLKAYPQGHFAPLARIRLNKLKTRPPQLPVAREPGDSAPDPFTAPADMPTPALAVPDVGWAGIEFTDTTLNIARMNGADRPVGAVVAAVSPYGPAAQAGIEQGDLIVAVDGKAALNYAELGALLDKTWPGRTVKVIVLRDGDRLDLDLTVGRLVADNMAKANAGNAEAMFRLGLVYETGQGTAKDPAAAAHWYRKAADLGDVNAQFGLAELYGSGTGIGKNDQAAASWYRRAADQGHRSAQVYLARRYQLGRGVPRDYLQAMQWFQAAADRGDPLGYIGLARLYEQGLGVTQDNASAAGFYQQAAALGSIPAQNNLAGMYWQGRGIARNRQEAARLWRSAAIRGGKSALQNLRKFGIDPFDAAEIQGLLATLGYNPGPIDGKPGRKTRAAIRQFQSDRGLAVDGTPSMDLTAALLIAEQDMRKRELVASLGLNAGRDSVQTADTGDVQDLENFD